jgi:predicted regulator of Ras-like GTPase activity (Roadblock/LC7/MglB family)
MVMIYQQILEEMLRAINGGQAAILLDANGEVVEGAGKADERFHLIAAYQGIALSTAQRTAERYDAGPIEYLLCRYENSTIVLRPLKEGFSLVLSLAPDASTAQGLRHSEKAKERLDAEM